jgi:hypothetical protein
LKLPRRRRRRCRREEKKKKGKEESLLFSIINAPMTQRYTGARSGIKEEEEEEYDDDLATSCHITSCIMRVHFEFRFLFCRTFGICSRLHHRVKQL